MHFLIAESQNGYFKRQSESTDHTTKVLKERFQKLMTELQKNGNETVKDIRDKVLAEVFDCKDSKESHGNGIQLDEMKSNSEV